MLVTPGHAFERPRLGEVRYVGEVEDNADPEGIGRCKIRIIDVFGSKIPTDVLPWAAPADEVGEGAGDQLGHFSVPIIGSHVLVYFHKEDLYSPIYEARLRAKNQLIDELAENYPERYGFKDSLGNFWYVDKTKDNDLVHFEHHTGTKLTIDKEGSVFAAIVKDRELIISENSVVNIGENSDVTVGNDSTLLIEGESDVTVKGNASLSIDGSATAVVKGSLDANVNGSADIEVSSQCRVTAGSLVAQVNGTAQVTVSGSCSLTTSSSLKVQASGLLEIITSAQAKLNAQQVIVTANRIELGASGTEPVVLGNKLAQFLIGELTPWLNSHAHTGNLGSPTSAPVAPFTSGSMVIGGSLYSKKNTSQ